jgi:hypothetical protein
LPDAVNNEELNPEADLVDSGPARAAWLVHAPNTTCHGARVIDGVASAMSRQDLGEDDTEQARTRERFLATLAKSQ